MINLKKNTHKNGVFSKFHGHFNNILYELGGDIKKNNMKIKYFPVKLTVFHITICFFFSKNFDQLQYSSSEDLK